MKRIVHIIPASHPSITPSVVRFYDRYFDHDLHFFLLYSEDESRPSYCPNGCSISHQKVAIDRRSILSCLRYIRVLQSYDLIILHSMTINWRTQLLIMVFFPSLFQKVAWINWGADLYNWKESADRSLFGKLRIRIYRRFCAHIKTFIAIFPPDIDVHARMFHNRARTYYAPYTGLPEVWEDIPAWRPRRRDSSTPLRVLIGHRCTEQVGHLGCLNALRKFNRDNVKIVIPLGQNENPNYVDLVKKTAIQAFGEKASFIDRYLSKDELCKLAKDIDVAFFNSPRQIALGTLRLLFFSGTKVFMPAESVMSRFLKSQGIPMQDIESLVSMDFEAFSQPVDMRSGYDYAARFQDYPAWARHWQGIYNELLQDKR